MFLSMLKMPLSMLHFIRNKETRSYEPGASTGDGVSGAADSNSGICCGPQLPQLQPGVWRRLLGL